MSDDLDDEIAELWQRMAPAVLERCDVVRRAVWEPAPDAELLEAARLESHKLAGSIGMYGLEAAGELAVRIDRLLVAGALSDESQRAELRPLVDELIEAVRAKR